MVKYFYTIALSFFGGVLLATLIDFNFAHFTFTFFLSLISFILWKRFENISDFSDFLFFGIALAFLSLGLLRVELAEQSFSTSPLRDLVGQEVTVTGVVKGEPEVREKNTMLQVKTETDILLVSVDKYIPVKYGDEIEVIGKLAQPESFVTELGRTFNYPGYLKAKGIEYRISFAEVKVLRSNQGNWVIDKLLAFKGVFVDRIETLIAEPASALGGGLLLGIKQGLGDDLEAAFRRTGIIHIVVLSGYNIMLVVAFVMYVLSYLLNSRLRLVFGIVAIVMFAFLVGLSATVVRASIMASLLLLIQATGRIYFVLRSLVLAALVMIIINPYLLVFDVGFQLSFLATLGLILVAPVLESRLASSTTWFGARVFVIATIATQIAVLPLLLYQIGELSLVAVLVNVLVLPMVPAAMLLTFAAGMMSFVSGSLATLVAVPAFWSLQYINEIALFFSSFSFAAFVVPQFPFYFVIIAYIVLGYLLWRFRHLFVPDELAKKVVHDTSVDSWTIEEEKDDDLKPKRVDESKDSSTREVPIFFR